VVAPAVLRMAERLAGWGGAVLTGGCYGCLEGSGGVISWLTGSVPAYVAVLQQAYQIQHMTGSMPGGAFRHVY
jgi:hypothetical protein